MRRAVVAVTVLVLATALADVWRASVASPNCETTMNFDGVTYNPYDVTEEIVGKDAVGVGLERGCGDDGRWNADVAVSRIEGVGPRVALVTPVAAHTLYVAADVTIDDLPSKVADLVTE